MVQRPLHNAVGRALGWWLGPNIPPLQMGVVGTACLLVFFQALDIFLVAGTVENQGLHLGGERFARVSSALLAAVYGPQVLSCIILGRLSDRHGRKPVIVWSIAGSLLFTLAAGSTKTLWQALPLRALGGALGGYASVAYAMACDVLDDTQSGMGVALLVTAWGLGSAVGQRAGVGLASALRAGQAWPVFADRPLLLPSAISCACQLLCLLAAARVSTSDNSRRYMGLAAGLQSGSPGEEAVVDRDARKDSGDTDAERLDVSGYPPQAAGLLRLGAWVPSIPAKAISHEEMLVIRNQLRRECPPSEEGEDAVYVDTAKFVDQHSHAQHGRSHSEDSFVGSLLAEEAGLTAAGATAANGRGQPGRGKAPVWGTLRWCGKGPSLEWACTWGCRPSLPPPAAAAVCAVYGLLCLAQVASGRALTHVYVASLALQEEQMSALRGIYCVWLVVLGVSVVPLLLRWLGQLRSLQLGLCGYVALVLLLPVHQRLPGLDQGLLWAFLALTTALRALVWSLVSIPSLVMINHGVLGQHLGAAHGTAQACASLAQVLGPAVAERIWIGGESLLGGCLWMVGGLVGVMLVVACLPQQLEVSNERNSRLLSHLKLPSITGASKGRYATVA